MIESSDFYLKIKFSKLQREKLSIVKTMIKKQNNLDMYCTFLENCVAYTYDYFYCIQNNSKRDDDNILFLEKLSRTRFRISSEFKCLSF